MSQLYEVAIIIPVRDRTELLKKCLSSLMKQKFPLQKCEILICDDGGSSDLSSLLQNYKSANLSVRILRQSHLGPAAARNLGIRSSQASIVIFLDSDVIVDEWLVNNLIEGLRRNPDWKGACASIQLLEANKSILWDAPSSFGEKAFHSGAIAYHREALIKAGGFDEVFPLPACEDVDLAMRVSSQGRIGFVPEARVYHPQRKITWRTHWNWRRFWRYEMILAKRYGILAFPGNPVGSFPRLRVALAAVATLPAGRFIEGLRYMKTNMCDGSLACAYAFFDVICGICALSSILFGPVPENRNYL